MGIDVTDIAPQLEPINLPRGRQDVPVREFNFHLAGLKKKMEAGDEQAERQLLHGLVPSITDAEIDDLSPGEKLWIVLYCGRRLEEVVEALGNAGGAAGTPGTSPSAPTTKSNTPSRGSRAPSAKTGGRSRSAPSGRPSTPSIG
jgi:hypothetical protein